MWEFLLIELISQVYICIDISGLKYLVSHEDEVKKSLHKPYYTFFLFVNPTSGGNQAAVLTKLDV